MGKRIYYSDNRRNVTKDEVERILEIGRLLSSVLSPEELEELHKGGKLYSPSSHLERIPSKIGNIGVT